MGNITDDDLKHLRVIHCTCDDGSLCAGFKADGLTVDCRESCGGFCKMWDELERMVFGSRPRCESQNRRNET